MLSKNQFDTLYTLYNSDKFAEDIVVDTLIEGVLIKMAELEEDIRILKEWKIL